MKVQHGARTRKPTPAGGDQFIPAGDSAPFSGRLRPATRGDLIEMVAYVIEAYHRNENPTAFRGAVGEIIPSMENAVEAADRQL